jgi:pyruvate decarboxylase
VIQECYIKSRPVYIYVPLDMVHRPVSQNSLLKPLSLSPLIDHTQEEKALSSVLEAIYSSKNPVLIVDALTTRYQAKTTAQELAEKLKFWTFCPPMGKSIIDETKPYFYGVYNGKFSYPGVQDAVEKESNLVLHLGSFPDDSNTSGLSAIIDSRKLIYVKPTSVVVKEEVFEGVQIKSCKSFGNMVERCS